MVVPIIAMEALSTSMGGLMSAVGSLKDKLSDLMAFADKAQKASLSIGMSFQQSSAALKPSIDNLRGSLENRFSAGIRTLEAGLQGNVAGVTKLINQQELTGTQFAKTAGVMAKLEVGLGLSRDQTNNLSESLIETGDKWNISTDKLVNALDSMAASLPVQKIAGWGDKFVGAVAEVQGMFGPQLQADINNVVKMITDTSLEGMRKLSVLGIEDIRQKITNAKSQEEVTNLLISSVRKANTSIDSFVKGNAFGGGIAALEYATSNTTLSFKTLADNIGKRVLDPFETEFQDTISTLNSEVWVPLQEWFLQTFYPPLLDFVKKMTEIGKTLTTIFTEELKGLNLQDVFKDLTVAIIDFTLYLVDTLPPVFAKIGRVMDWIADKEKMTEDYKKGAMIQSTIATGPGVAMLRTDPASEALRKKVIEESSDTFVSPEEKAAAKFRERLVNSLDKVRDSVLAVDTSTKVVADNTGNLLGYEDEKNRQTRSLYLDESTKTLDMAIRRVLGLGGANQMEKLESLVERLITNQEASIDQRSTESTSLEMNAVIKN